MKCYLSWSGGKDSSASIVIAHERGITLDGIIFCEVMFDHKRQISGENPKHIQWVYNTAIPIIERFGYKVIILRDRDDYLTLFNKRIQHSKIESRIGKKQGWVLGGHCEANNLKVRPIRTFYKSVGEYEEIVGIAADEETRLKRLKANARSLLAENNIVENETYALCRKFGLLSPIYEDRHRGGCWFCPNCSIKCFAALKREYPDLWNELQVLSKDPDIVSQGFKYGRTFGSIEREVDCINNQMSIFDFI